MNKLQTLIEELETKISKQDIINSAVSKSGVGWHIEHTLLVINSIIAVMKKSNPDEYKWKFNFNRMLVFFVGKIPRGRAKAPKAVTPSNDFNAETMQKHFASIKSKLQDLDNLDKNSFFEHPYFGKLNLKPAVKFLYIHTKHHLDIINDIVAK